MQKILLCSPQLHLSGTFMGLYLLSKHFKVIDNFADQTRFRLRRSFALHLANFDLSFFSLTMIDICNTSAVKCTWVRGSTCAYKHPPPLSQSGTETSQWGRSSGRHPVHKTAGSSLVQVRIWKRAGLHHSFSMNCGETQEDGEGREMKEQRSSERSRKDQNRKVT